MDSLIHNQLEQKFNDFRLTFQDLTLFLQDGTLMLKLSEKPAKKPYTCRLSLDLKTLQLLYTSLKGTKQLDVSQIKELRRGQNTRGFEIQGKRVEYEERAFTIIYSTLTGYKMLEVVSSHARITEIWLTILTTLIQLIQSETLCSSEAASFKNHLKKLFTEVDVKSKNEIDVDGIVLLFRKLNIKITKSEVKSALKGMSENTRSMTFPTFENYYHSLKERQEIQSLFSDLKETEGITLPKFTEFVNTVQKNEWTEEQCLDYFEKYSDLVVMDQDHFSSFLISANNSIFVKNGVLGDCMDLPLSRYYINSSHNTYLLGDQLTGESSVEGYIRALQKGCRCVELDCWDGPHGQPIIYHGKTLTSKVLFKDVVEAIKKYAFVSSVYPVILSLEIHCSIEQQDIMARVFKEILGDLLVTEVIGQNETELPSPNQLQNRILIKCKGADLKHDFEDEDNESDFNVLNIPLDSIPIMQTMQPSHSADNLFTSLKKKLEPAPKKQFIQIKTAKKEVSKTLAELSVYCQARHFPDLTDKNDLMAFNEISSLSEKKVQLLITLQKVDLLKHNQTCLTRIYPLGTRVNSSNYSPIECWAAGCQLVALNFQTIDRGYQINDALFAMNACSGYVLKPVEPAKPINLSITIISGQQLPKSNDSKKGVSDPYIEIELAGLEVDQIKYKTKAVHDDGLKPTWNTQFNFKILEPDYAFLRLVVMDVDKLGDTVVAYFAIPVCNLRQGYRHAPLLNRRGEVLRFSSLFLKISMTDCD